MRDYYTTNSHHLTYTFLFERFGRMYFLNLGVKGCMTWSADGHIISVQQFWSYQNEVVRLHTKFVSLVRMFKKMSLRFEERYNLYAWPPHNYQVAFSKAQEYLCWGFYQADTWQFIITLLCESPPPTPPEHTLMGQEKGGFHNEPLPI